MKNESIKNIIFKKEEENNKYFEKLRWFIFENLNKEYKDYNVELPSYDIQASFYNKAYIYVNTDEYDNYVITLYSYDTPILMIDNGVFKRLWNSWSQTTGRHIKAFCGFNKKEFFEIPYYKEV